MNTIAPNNLFRSPTTHKHLSAYQVTLLKSLWSLPDRQRHLVDEDQLYLTTVAGWSEFVVPEEYPYSFVDSLAFEDHTFEVTYIFTSGNFLEQLLNDHPEQIVVFRLRKIAEYNFYQCLVRRWDHRWSRKKLLDDGAKEL